VRENCDALARIPIAPAAGSLNVAVAAGIALCAASRLRRDRKERHDREGAGR
jgi:tRNA G18 (ribose-2'-O)-methylase SpoU